MISVTFDHAGHLFSAATLSEISLCDTTPINFPVESTTPADRTCFSRRYFAASRTLLVSGMENTSLRDPIRSATFIGPSGGRDSAHMLDLPGIVCNQKISLRPVRWVPSSRHSSRPGLL